MEQSPKGSMDNPGPFFENQFLSGHDISAPPEFFNYNPGIRSGYVVFLMQYKLRLFFNHQIPLIREFYQHYSLLLDSPIIEKQHLSLLKDSRK